MERWCVVTTILAPPQLGIKSFDLDVVALSGGRTTLPETSGPRRRWNTEILTRPAAGGATPEPLGVDTRNQLSRLPG